MIKPAVKMVKATVCEYLFLDLPNIMDLVIMNEDCRNSSPSCSVTVLDTAKYATHAYTYSRSFTHP